MSDVTGVTEGTPRNGSRGARRRNQILELLDKNPSAPLKVEDIARIFDVSLATARRDLASLRDSGRITRTYGGAEARRLRAELPTTQRQNTRATEKIAIAQHAVRMISPGALILLDAGTTTQRAVPALPTDLGITLVTNGIGNLLALADRPDINTIVLGGRLRTVNQTISGMEAESTLRQLYAEIAFIGADAVDPIRGVASRTLEQSRLKSLMMEHARKTVVLADSTKLQGAYSPYWSTPAGNWTLITDTGASQHLHPFRSAPHLKIEIARLDVGSNGAMTNSEIG